MRPMLRPMRMTLAAMPPLRANLLMECSFEATSDVDRQPGGRPPALHRVAAADALRSSPRQSRW
jgi:hypothetical protein